MKKLLLDYRKGNARLIVESQDDLWSLSQIISPGDKLGSMTARKVKICEAEDRQKTVKKPAFIKVLVEKTEFSPPTLKILGTIEEAPEDIPHGQYHSLILEQGSEIFIEKEWLSYQKHRLEDSLESKTPPVIIVVFDREEAYFAIMKKYGYEVLTNIKGKVRKKGHEEGTYTDFYSEIVLHIKEYDSRFNPSFIVVGSPAFWKDELMKAIGEGPLKRKIVPATCSSVDITGINEILKRDEVRKALASERITKEMRCVEELMSEISKNGKAAYGLKDVEEASISGAVETLLIADGFIRQQRQDNNFAAVESIMKRSESQNSKIAIISSEHDGGKKLEGIGGIAAILRYRMK